MHTEAIGPWSLALSVIFIGTMAILTMTCANETKSKQKAYLKREKAKTQTLTPNKNQKAKASKPKQWLCKTKTYTTSGEQFSKPSSQMSEETNHDKPLKKPTRKVYLPKRHDSITGETNATSDLGAPLSTGMDLSLPEESAPKQEKLAKTTTETRGKTKEQPLGAAKEKSKNECGSKTYANIPDLLFVTRGAETKQMSVEAFTKVPTTTNKQTTCLDDPTASVDIEEQFKAKPRKNPTGEIKPRKFRNNKKSLNIKAGLRKTSKDYPTMDDVISDWDSEKAVAAPCESAK